MHFVESQYIIEYFTWSDVFSSFGGIFASLELGAGWISAFVVIWFLWKVTKIIKINIVQKSYKDKVKQYLITANEKLNLILDNNIVCDTTKRDIEN